MFEDANYLAQLFIQEKSTLFRDIVEKSVDSIVVTDSAYRIAYTNTSSNRLLGYVPTGQLLTSIWVEDDIHLLDAATDWVKVGGFFSAARLNGFRSVIDRYPNIKVVGTLAADWRRENARLAAEELLTLNPQGMLDAIWAVSSEMALGAVEAVEAAGRQDEVKIFSNDVTPETCTSICEGRILADTHHGFAEWGWYGVKFGVMLALGQPVTPVFDIRPRTAYRGNVDSFYPVPDLGMIDWETIRGHHPLPVSIVIGWIQMASVPVYQTATDFFDIASADARQHGINVEVLTRIPASSEDFAGQAAIIDNYIAQKVDAIVCSTVAVDIIKQALARANTAGIPIIITNQLEPIDGIDVACYIGFDNTVAGKISGYSLVNYLGGPGVFGQQESVSSSPGTYFDLGWWEALYQHMPPHRTDLRGRVAVLEGISGSWRGENRLACWGGGTIHTDFTLFPIHNQAGQFAGLVASFRDATERKLAEDRLRSSHDELEKRVVERTLELSKANEEVRQFAYIVSHDLRAPMVNIKGFSSVLADAVDTLRSTIGANLAGIDVESRNIVNKALEEDIREAVTYINASVTRMDHLINAILKLSRLGSREIHPEVIDMNALVQVIVNSLAHQVAERSAQVTIGELPDVIADRTAMEQMMGNILANAILYLDKQRPGRIEVIGEQLAGETIFHIRDNGRGIAEENRSKVFAPFRRAGNHAEQGEGMGLAYVDILVRRHGGQIWFHSELGVGTTFSFTIKSP